MSKRTETKLCSYCKEEVPLSFFNKDSSQKDGFQGYCRPCRRLYNQKNKSRFRQNNTEYRKELDKKNMIFVLSYSKTKGCIDCGETDPRVLEFDHVRGQKIITISELVRQAPSHDRLMIELEKCEVRCVNCHRIKTSIDQNWYKYLDLKDTNNAS